MNIKRALEGQSTQTTKFLMMSMERIRFLSENNDRYRQNHPINKWFDGEVLEHLNSRDKRFQEFKKSSLHIDKELFKKAKYKTLKLIGTKSRFW